MKTAELIKQAEELLWKCSYNRWESDPSDEEMLMHFARDHIQELVDRLKRYEEALRTILAEKLGAPYDEFAKELQDSARKALEEE